VALWQFQKLLDFTVAEINSVEFFKTPFRNLMGSKQLTEYTIMNIERVQEKDRRKFAGQGTISKKVCFNGMNNLDDLTLTILKIACFGGCVGGTV